MSDFIFSTNKAEPNKITKILKKIYNESSHEIEEFHGVWGSLGVCRNLYNGFNPYETEGFISVVIGGPVLMFCENSFLKDKDSYEGTKAIFDRWRDCKIKWDQDLSGPFVMLIINKLTNEVICTTDLMSLIPVYWYSKYKNMVLSTHVDLMAKFTQQTNKLDDISTVDFILNGIITYPYTRYQNISELAPASNHIVIDKGTELETTMYWLPIEKNMYDSLDLATNDLREALKKYIYKITSQTTNIAQFISAGEDSRLLSGLLKKYPRDAFIFLDKMNREGRIAKKAANLYDANFKLFTRDSTHYLDILPKCSELVGSSAQYLHAHTYGFHEKCNLLSYSAVFGGLYADALFKGSRIKKIKLSGKVPFIPEIKESKDITINLLNNTIFHKNIINELIKRRKSHLNYIKKFRGDSADEWFELWPSSMNPAIPNLDANRRLFRSYEPFLSNEIIKISASAPQKWKLNRKLFHKMAKPLLKPSKRLRHNDGWYPYYSWVFKSINQPVTRLNRKIIKKIGFNKGNQGSWAEYDVIVKSKEWSNNIYYYTSDTDNLSTVLNTEIKTAINSNDLSTIQRFNFLQILYMNKEWNV